MATLAEVVSYLKFDSPGAKGSPTPLSEVKALSEEDRAELRESLDKLPPEERGQA